MRQLAAVLVNRDRWTPAGIAALFAVDIVWCAQAGIAFAGWSRIVAVAVALLLVVAFYTNFRPRPALAEAVLYAALWVGFTAAGACLTYLAASLDMPLHDALYTRLDSALGFDWLAWAHFLQAHPVLLTTLALVYRTLGLQIILSIILLAFRGVTGRNEELLRGVLLSLVITTLVFAVGVSLGPVAFYHYDGASADTAAYLPQLMSLRSHAETVYQLSQIQGIIPFPSYHVVMAILLTYAQRSNKWTLGFFALLNLAMLPSIPTEGSHYLVDLIAGAAIAVLTIALLRQADRRWGRAAATLENRAAL